MDQDTFVLLRELHLGNWSEELMESSGLGWVYLNVLTPTERIIVAHKVAGDVDGEVAMLLGISPLGVKRHIREIEYKYRNQIGSRISNHPAIRAQKGFHVRRNPTRAKKV